MSSPQKSTAELASNFYYFNQFGFTKAPVTMGDGGDKKLRRVATALCEVSGADGNVSKVELDFILGYCACKGYPQSIIDDIPKMCKAAEAKSLPKDAINLKEVLTTGAQKNVASHRCLLVVYDSIRAASADGLCESELTAIDNVAKSLGLSSEELHNIHVLVEKEEKLKEERIKLLCPGGHPCLP